MPLTSKGNEILHSMQSEYGAKKGEQVFYASKNAGRITGVDAADHLANHRRLAADALRNHGALHRSAARK